MKRLLTLAISTSAFFACGEKVQQPVATQAPQTAEDNGLEEDFFGSNDDWSDDGFSVANTCTFDDKDNCEELRVTIKAADATTGDRVSSSVDGRAREPIALAFTVEASSSKYEDGVNDPERVALGFRGLPSDADTEVDGLTGAFLWVPESITNGSIEVVFRDVGRCLVEEAYNKKGKLDEDKAEECEDLENTGFSKYEETKKYTYRIEKSRLEIQKDAALNSIDAQCKANMMTSMLGGLPALFGGNPTAILSVGVSGFAGQMQCKAQKEQIEAQFDAQTID